MQKETFGAVASLLLLVAAVLSPLRAQSSAAAYLLYTGGLFGQLEPCG